MSRKRLWRGLAMDVASGDINRGTTADSGSEALPVFLGQTAGLNPGIWEGNDDSQANVMRSSAWRLPSRYGNVTVTHLSLFCSSATGSCVMGIYTDVSNAPGNLVASTAAFTLANGHNKRAVTTPATLTAGNRYWLVYNPSSNTPKFQSRLGFEEVLSRDGTHTYDGTMPSTFTTSAGPDYTPCMYAVCTSLSLTKPAATTPPSSPPTLTGGGSLAGYTLSWHDEFDWYDREAWTNEVWWLDTAAFDSQYVDSGALNLVARNSSGYRDIHVDTLGFKEDFREGYYECRMWADDVPDAFGAFWLYATSWGEGVSCPAFELDIVEVWPRDGNDRWSGTVHSNTADTAYCTNAAHSGGHPGKPDSQNSNSYRDTDGTIMGQWHTYGCLWEPTRLRWYLDNAYKMEVTIGAGTDWDTSSTDCYLLLYNWCRQMGPGPTLAEDGAEFGVKFDWVRVWTP